MRQLSTITVIGRDKTGVVASVSSFLFEHGANIEAMEESVTRGQFSMTLQASWQGRDWDPERIRTGLRRLARQLTMEIAFRVLSPDRTQRVALMVTKESHCLEALLAEFKKRRLPVEPALVLSNRPDLEPLAAAADLPFQMVGWNDRTRAEEKALKLLQRYDIDFVVLARFMKILSPNFVWRYKNKIINIHPSLLPSFPGPQAYRQAYEHGVKIAGVTAHFVNMHLDEGPIIAQEAFRIHPRMSLKDIIAKGQKLEARTLVKAVKLYALKHLDVHWGVVKSV